MAAEAGALATQEREEFEYELLQLANTGTRGLGVAQEQLEHPSRAGAKDGSSIEGYSTFRFLFRERVVETECTRLSLSLSLSRVRIIVECFLFVCLLLGRQKKPRRIPRERV